MTIEEIKKKYKNQWVLAKVLKENKLNQVTEAKVILVSPNKEEIYRALSRVQRGEHICTFYTGEILPKGMAFAFHTQNTLICNFRKTFWVHNRLMRTANSS